MHAVSMGRVCHGHSAECQAVNASSELYMPRADYSACNMANGSMHAVSMGRVCHEHSAECQAVNASSELYMPRAECARPHAAGTVLSHWQ
jgi:hypothetical protein